MKNRDSQDLKYIQDLGLSKSPLAQEIIAQNENDDWIYINNNGVIERKTNLYINHN